MRPTLDDMKNVVDNFDETTGFLSQQSGGETPIKTSKSSAASSPAPKEWVSSVSSPKGKPLSLFASVGMTSPKEKPLSLSASAGMPSPSSMAHEPKACTSEKEKTPKPKAEKAEKKDKKDKTSKKVKKSHKTK